MTPALQPSLAFVASEHAQPQAASSEEVRKAALRSLLACARPACGAAHGVRATSTTGAGQIVAAAFLRCALAAWAGLLLGGCGGGGGGSAPPPPPPPPPPVSPEPPSPPPIVVPETTADERFPGGEATTSLSNEEAFGQSPEAIQQDFSADANFKSGNQIFRNSHDGEGPLLNARTCQGCHTKDGRGAVPPNQETPMDSMVVRLGLGIDDDGATVPDPNYGRQLQTFGLASFIGDDISAGLSAFGEGAGEAIGEGFALVEYETIEGAYADGVPFELRRPVVKVRELSYGDFSEGIQFSARVAPQLIGLGLLEAVPEADIRSLADPDDADGDGISGRANSVFDPTEDALRLGRFGPKAGTASLLQQTVNAYRNDMGVTNRFVPEEACAERQISCQQVALQEENPHPGNVDIGDVELALVEFYLRLLAVPERRGFDEARDIWEEDVQRGRTLFFETGCGACHQYRHVTGTAAGSVLGAVELNTLFPDAPDIAVLSEQRIFPYTDLLLHDMGGACEPVQREAADGSFCAANDNCVWTLRCTGLADGKPEGLASASEWRTAPLWGLGLVKIVNERATFLHDGRARTIAEAVLWHGGEAQRSRDAFVAMNAADRSALIAFLESL